MIDILDNQQKCDRCNKSFLFMKLYPLNQFSDFKVCVRCLEYDKRRKK